MNSEANAGSSTIEITLISHTNSGKTTLARTLLGRDIGEVRDAPHVTEIAEAHTLLQTHCGDVLRLWDTPGFGDSARLVQRLRLADNPIGWLLREVWDRYRDRPFWCSQQAVRAARENSDVLLYLVNAAEDPRDAGYVAFEAQILRWVGKPIVALLNQVGPPRPAEEERAEAQRWQAHLESLGVASQVLTLDAFARCWVQERVLLDAIGRNVPEQKRAAYARLVATWIARNVTRFDAAMHVLAEQLAHAACDREPVQAPAAGSTSAPSLRKVMQSAGMRAVGIARGEREPDAARERAMKALAERLDGRIRAATDSLIALHGLDGQATQTVMERMRTNFAVQERVDETRSALFGSVIMGALTGLKADVAAGGMTLGAGMLVGGLIGGLTGAGVARGYNRLAGNEHPEVRWSADFLDALARSSVLRYLAVAHFGRGRGKWVEGEAPAFWRAEVEQQFVARAARFHTIWISAIDAPEREPLTRELENSVAQITAATLQHLYPAMLPIQLQAPSG